MENTTPNTNNFLNWVEIKNFKSIKDLRLDCKRVNVFIGKPNVGKSNILEGLGLLGAIYDKNKFLEGSVRYKELKSLFYDNDLTNSVSTRSDQQIAGLYAKELGATYEIDFNYFLADQTDVNGHDERGDLELLEDYSGKNKIFLEGDGSYSSFQDGKTVRGKRFNSIKKYDFANLTDFPNLYQVFLLPPNGPNLYEVIRRNKDLWAEFAKLFTQQQLELVLYDQKQEIILQKKDGPFVIQYPYFSIADTFRRFMFYITAIESNKNSVLIFEEPEVHSFPPYTQDVAYRMVYSEENQFFVSTHSPYLLQTLVSNLKDDQLNVFVTYYENYETKVKALTPEELSFVQEYSTDVFFNLDRFIPNAQPANPA